jgi:xanthine dehydrogenase YagR molybdenum-binding subunit
LVEDATNTPHDTPPLIGPALIRRGRPVFMGGAQMKDRMQFAHGAQFVEVRIDRWTGMLRVARMVGVFAAGHIMNRRTAWAQLNGGQIWGASAALLEATELDHKLARYVNEDFADYHVPVSADVGEVETIMLDEVDTLVNPLGIKGVGELGVTGVNAAVANAVYHATGVRLRRLPIRVGDIPGEALR